MHELLDYLNSPYLVASFQKIFGIDARFNNENSTHSPSQVTYVDNHVVHTRSTSKKVPAATTLTPLKSTSNGGTHQRPHQNSATNEPVATTLNEGNNQNKEEANGKKKKVLNNNTDVPTIVASTTIHNKFWYYLFHLGAAMGNEIFYCIFFPFWFWNVDGAIARKVALLWGIFMYVGQATKDLLCMPRPASPPVVKLEQRYVAEYGFPSTHAMVSAGLPISVVVLSYFRYNINLYISVAIVTVFCCWVCSSRLYLGMHSLLDVIAGVLYSILVLVLVIPVLEPIDTFILDNPASPLLAIIVGYTICHYYPSLKQWSTARGDTTIIIGTVVGFSIGAHLNNILGFLHRPESPPLYDIQFPNAFGYFLGVIRTILGLISLGTTRQIFKKTLFRLLCHLNKLNPNDPATKQQKKIELPYNYFCYMAIGLNIAFISPCLFKLLGIERDYSYTEL